MIETEFLGEELPAQCTRSDEEAGSIVLHVSRAAKVTEEISKEDMEIRRLIEERRETPKEEKQRLQEVSKHVQNVSGTKNEKTAIHPTHTRRLQRSKERSSPR